MKMVRCGLCALTDTLLLSWRCWPSSMAFTSVGTFFWGGCVYMHRDRSQAVVGNLFKKIGDLRIHTCLRCGRMLLHKTLYSFHC